VPVKTAIKNKTMKLNKIQKIGAFLGAMALIFGGGYTATNLGSVALGGDYHSTSTEAGFVDGTVVQSGPGTLGSVVITGSTTGTLVLYDATSTVTNTSWATTTLATFPASTAAGTYTFDIMFQKGLMVVAPSAGLATSTITWRGR